MKAILVEFSLTTRVLVDDDFDIDNMKDKDYQLLRDKVIPKLHERLNEDGIGDMIAEIRDDEELPFGSILSDTGSLNS